MRRKITKDNYDAAEKELRGLIAAMARVYKSNAYDLLLECAAEIRPTLPPLYYPELRYRGGEDFDINVLRVVRLERGESLEAAFSKAGV